jgi:hypothetical protein
MIFEVTILLMQKSISKESSVILLLIMKLRKSSLVPTKRLTRIYIEALSDLTLMDKSFENITFTALGIYRTTSSSAFTAYRKSFNTNYDCPKYFILLAALFSF